ncbi:MAG: hypothetical protein AAF432_12735 [Planctomycetota bacterium]
MSTAATNKIDDLMERASQALASTQYFETERLALAALSMAHTAQDYERMARIVLPLLECRRHRYQQAFDIGTLTVLTDEEPINEEYIAEPGCFVIVPMLVGADGRRLRAAAFAQEKPLAVICREPTTRLGLIPVVAVGGGLSIRNHVEPPDDEDAPDLAWLAEAMRAVGDAAIESLDPTMDASRRVNGLLDRIDACPDHEDLHQLLMSTCKEAHEEQQEKLERRRARTEGASSA